MICKYQLDAKSISFQEFFFCVQTADEFHFIEDELDKITSAIKTCLNGIDEDIVELIYLYYDSEISVEGFFSKLMMRTKA